MSAPGISVSDPAAARTPQSVPEACDSACRRVVMGRTAERARESAIRYSTQENMKQKKAATPIPAAMVGRKILMKNFFHRKKIQSSPNQKRKKSLTEQKRTLPDC